MNIHTSSVFVNSDGRTVKIERIEGSGKNATVYYHVDGSSHTVKDPFSNFNSMLESGGYKDITHVLSSFFAPTQAQVGTHKTHGDYKAEVIKSDSKGVHVKFSDAYNSTNYIYDPKGFDINTIFTNEVLSDLSEQFSSSVFEVIAGNKNKTKDFAGHIPSDIKFTVIGSAVNSDLLDKIKKVHGDIDIFQIKRLTNINIK